jgi:hypothetical protein
MYTLTLQAYASGEWLDAMTLIFVEPEQGFEGACRFGYKSEALFEGLREDANRLSALPDVRSAGGLPEVTLNHPAIALRDLEQQLESWGLK